MKWNNLLLLLILVATISCAKKARVLCGLSADTSVISIESKVLKFKTIGIKDTTIASISGQVFYKDLSGKDTIIGDLIGANVMFKETISNKIYGASTDEEGKYFLNVPPSKYTIIVQFIGFNNLIIKNVPIQSGVIIEFSTILGQGDGDMVYYRKPNGIIVNEN